MVSTTSPASFGAGCARAIDTPPIAIKPSTMARARDTASAPMHELNQPTSRARAEDSDARVDDRAEAQSARKVLTSAVVAAGRDARFVSFSGVCSPHFSSAYVTIFRPN